MKTFDSILGFVEHISVLAIAEEIATKTALEKCAQLVEDRAKEKIGEYQDQVGPFIAWAELADSTKRDREAKGFSENDPLLRTGALRDSVEHTLSGLEAQIGSDSDVAVYQELGTKNMLPRSFLGGAIAEKVPEIQKILGTSIVATLIGEQVVPGGIAIEG